MAQYKLIDQCAGGEHLRLMYTGDDGKQHEVACTLSQLVARDPGSVDESLRDLVQSKDAVEILAKLQAGVTPKPSDPKPGDPVKSGSADPVVAEPGEAIKV